MRIAVGRGAHWGARSLLSLRRLSGATCAHTREWHLHGLYAFFPVFPLRPRKLLVISIYFPLATLLGAPEDSTKDSCAHDTVRGR